MGWYIVTNTCRISSAHGREEVVSCLPGRMPRGDVQGGPFLSEEEAEKRLCRRNEAIHREITPCTAGPRYRFWESITHD
jgi:hypothetical protein